MVDPLYYTKGTHSAETAVALSPTTQTIYVIFRGTNDGQIFDDLADIYLLKGPYGPTDSNPPILPGRVHRGFNRRVFDPNLYLPLSQVVKNATTQYPTFKLVITGHSLGAALATLYGAYLATQVVPSQRVSVLELAFPPELAMALSKPH